MACVSVSSCCTRDSSVRRHAWRACSVARHRGSAAICAEVVAVN
jgi:hypothetical protein